MSCCASPKTRGSGLANASHSRHFFDDDVYCAPSNTRVVQKKDMVIYTRDELRTLAEIEHRAVHRTRGDG
jgi:hypothetical protein